MIDGVWLNTTKSPHIVIRLLLYARKETVISKKTEWEYPQNSTFDS